MSEKYTCDGCDLEHDVDDVPKFPYGDGFGGLAGYICEKCLDADEEVMQTFLGFRNKPVNFLA